MNGPKRNLLDTISTMNELIRVLQLDPGAKYRSIEVFSHVGEPIVVKVELIASERSKNGVAELVREA